MKINSACVFSSFPHTREALHVGREKRLRQTVLACSLRCYLFLHPLFSMLCQYSFGPNKSSFYEIELGVN